MHAIDVSDTLHPKMKGDARVTCYPNKDARDLSHLDVKVDFSLIEVTFASPQDLLPSILHWTRLGGHVLALVKPPHAAGGRAQKVKDESECVRIVADVIQWVKGQGFAIRGSILSPLFGKSVGQAEFLLLFQIPAR